MGEPTVAVFRPDDGRLEETVAMLESYGVDPVPDPMLEIDPTGATPREDADYAIITSTTGVERAVEGEWNPGTATVCAIGPRTAEALEDAGYAVEVVPEEYTSSGLVETLEGEVDGARVEIARSDHGSAVLPESLEAAGAYVHETALYRLVCPESSGESAKLAADGELDATLFTSPLTVEHFLEAAEAGGIREKTLTGLEETVVAAIGEPTRKCAADLGVTVDVVPEEATSEALVEAALAELED
ncbi:uroporphyrinogen-III synthase [Natrialbaceae archaeon A-gly3]